MDQRVFDVIVKSAREVIKQHGCSIDEHGAAFLRRTLRYGQCVDIILPKDGGDCPMLISGTLDVDTYVMFFHSDSTISDGALQKQFMEMVKAAIEEL